MLCNQLHNPTLGVPAGAIGSGLAAGLLILLVITSTLVILLYVLRQYRLKHSKADPAMADDIQMTQREQEQICFRFLCHTRATESIQKGSCKTR